MSDNNPAVGSSPEETMSSTEAEKLSLDQTPPSQEIPSSGEMNLDTVASSDLPLDTVNQVETAEATSAPSQLSLSSGDGENTTVITGDLTQDNTQIEALPVSQKKSLSSEIGDNNEVAISAKAIPEPDGEEASPIPPITGTPLLDSDKSEIIDPETTDEKLKYPRSVFFIISNEFCERFSYYGMRTILVIYLTNILLYSEDNATIIYHVFSMFCYFFPIFGSMLADSLLGKFRTILYLSVIYCIGNIVISLASAKDTIAVPGSALTIVGLLLIAIGTGGIKPCVSAFGGDQFVLPQQEKQMAQFFSLFYFAINSGSLVSTFLTPVLREEKCLDQESCYPLAFGVPAALMLLSIIIFICGKNLYIIKKPQGNVVLRVCKTMGHAISEKWNSKGPKREHWLDYADDKYAKKEIEDIKAALRVLFLYLPLPFFWALFDQQGSRWTFQAKRMTGDLGGWSLKPDQMQVVNPLLILLFIPMFETCLYPCLKKCNLLTKPLQRLGVGGVLAAVAFGISAIVELQLEPTYAVLPKAGEAQIRIFNTFNYPVTVTINGRDPKIVDARSMWLQEKWPADSSPINITYAPGGSDVEPIVIKEKMAYSFALYENKVLQTVDDVEKPTAQKDGENKAKLRYIYNNRPILIGDKEFEMEEGKTISKQTFIVPDSYSVNEKSEKPERLDEIVLKVGGVYTLVVPDDNEKPRVFLNEITPANTVHMLWLIPQYVVITMGEVMYSVTGLEFSYSQAPLSMKSLMQAGWLLTVAFGNLIVVIIAEAKIFDRQLFEFILFAGLMLVDMLIFSLMALGYTYKETPHEDQGEMSLEKTKEKTGVENKNFKAEED